MLQWSHTVSKVTFYDSLSELYYIFFLGAKFHPGISNPKKSQIIKKGTNPLLDSYSAFYDNTDIKGSGDTGLRKLVKDTTEIVVVGLAQVK